MRLRRRDRRLQGQVSGNHHQRAQPRCRLRRRGRGDQGQQGQQGPAGARRHRRRPVLWPAAKADGLLSPTRSRPGTRSRQRQGCRRPLVRRLLRRHVVQVNKDLVPKRAERLGRPAEAGICQRRRAGRRSAHVQPGHPGASMPPACRGARRRRSCRRRQVSTSSRSSTTPATSCRSSARPARSRRAQTPIIIAWDYNALPGATRLRAIRRSTSSCRSRRCRGRLCAGDQRLRAASERCEALDGISLFRRRSVRLAEGLLPPDPLQRPLAKGLVPKEMLDKLPPAEGYAKAVFPSLDAVNANSEAVKAGWDSVVGANVVQ